MTKWLRRKKWWIIGVIVTLVVAVIIVVLSRKEEEPIETIVVGYTTVKDEVDVTGTVQPVERYDLSFSTAGVLKSFEVEEGESVVAGQILATLDASDAAFLEAQANAVLISSLETAQLALQKEQEGLSELKSLNKIKLDESKQAVKNAKVTLDTAKDQLRRIQGNNTDEAAATYRAAEAAYTTASNAYKTAQKSLSVLKQANVQAEATAEANVTVAEKAAQLKEDTINASGALSANKASLQYQRALLAKSMIRASADGVVARVEGSVGEYVSPTTPVITIVSSELRLSVNVPETEAAKLNIDDEATVKFDSFRDDEFNARISVIDSIETIVDGVTTYEITLVFSEQDARLRSGMTADLIILAEEKSNVLAVPQRAVSGARGHRLVEVVRGEERESVVVETGLRGSFGLVEITSGLSEGDEVVVFDPNAEE